MGTTGHTHRYRTHVAWEGSTGVGYDRYDRSHAAGTEPSTVDLELASDPAFRGDPSRLNPEQLLVLAASSCQLLSFLAVAARARLDVVSYRDGAEGEMPEDDRPVRITRIVLRPQIVLADPVADGDAAARERRLERVRHLVEVAHRECYIASSLRTEVVVEPDITFIAPSAALP